MKKYYTKLVLVFIFVAFQVIPFISLQAQERPEEWEIHVNLGIPKDSDPSDDYLIKRKQYVISYNKNKNVANWVSWNLNKRWYGSTARYKGKFITDDELPESFYHVTHDDYTNSGFNRGHMVRSEERTKNKTDNKSTFLLTNILPQTPDLNQGVWLRFEKYCEKLCKKKNKELYVIAGGVFHTNDKINGLIAIPDSCFKIVVVLNRDEASDDVDEQTEVIAVMMPNEDGVRNDPWEDYRTTIDRIEHSTGYDFLSNVSKSIQEVIESR